MEMVAVNTRVMTQTRAQCVAATKSTHFTQTARPAAVSAALSNSYLFEALVTYTCTRG